MMREEWFTLEAIEESTSDERLYCIAVDSPEKQFLAGNIGVPTHNTEAGKDEDQSKGEAAMILGSIARLGRAAGVHLIIATQRPDADILPSETKSNLSVRINCGRSMGNASSMILESSEGMRVKANPRGRLYLKVYGHGDHGQGFFAPQDWIDKYLDSQGKNQDGSPKTKKKSRLANLADISAFEGSTLDEREGVDNEGAIERIRDEEAEETEDSFEAFVSASEDDDYGFAALASADEGEEGEEDAFDEEEEDEDEEATAQASASDRPLLTNGKTTDDPWHRPEDDWDEELEDLIRMNNN